MLNVIVLILYRFGYGGDFLGIGGTWNLNEEKSPDAEIIASGVIVGYLIYTCVQLFTYLFGTTKHKRELSDTIMNVVGVLLWLGVAGTALHYWHGYQPVHDFTAAASERMVWISPRTLNSKTSRYFNLSFHFSGWFNYGILDFADGCTLPGRFSVGLPPLCKERERQILSFWGTLPLFNFLFIKPMKTFS